MSIPPDPVLYRKADKLWIPGDEVEFESEDSLKVPLFADARTIKATLHKQVGVLESLQDGLEGSAADHMADALFYLTEAMDALDKI